MPEIPYDGSCEAEYQDGYIHCETSFDDISPYVNPWKEVQADDDTWSWINAGTNIFSDILEKRPETNHGPMVRFSMFYKNERYDVDWVGLPDSARPVRFKDFARKSQGGGWIEEPQLVSVGFGYQYTDEDGKNVQEIIRL